MCLPYYGKVGSFVKQIERKTVCGCCGKEIIQTVTISRYQSDIGLDGRPTKASALPLIQECKYCHYCSIDLGKKISDKAKSVVMSAEYQNILKKDYADMQICKLKAAIYATEDIRAKGYLYLVICWYMEIHNLQGAIEMRRCAVNIMEELFVHGADLEEILVYIDCLRILGRMAEAQEQITAIEELIEDNFPSDNILYKRYKFEQQLVLEKDRNAHYISEV